MSARPSGVELGGQRSEHVRIEVHPSRRRPVLGVWNDEGAMTAAAPLHDKDLAPLIHGVDVGKLAVEPEVGRPSRPRVPHSVLFKGLGPRVGEVEGLEAVGALVEPVGHNSPEDLDWREPVTVRGVVVVQDRVELDVGALCDPPERRDVHVERAGTRA